MQVNVRNIQKSKTRQYKKRRIEYTNIKLPTGTKVNAQGLIIELTKDPTITLISLPVAHIHLKTKG